MRTFEELGLQPELLNAVQDLGFVNPTPVQDEVIPLLLDEPTDMVVLSQTGTGKTAAFGLPMLQRIDPSTRGVQALVLSPTRELCVQITQDLQSYAAHMPDINIVPVYGGANITNQISALKKGAQIIVATPGRMVDLLERKAVKLDTVATVVLDESDEMLNMGFSDSLNFILEKIPQQRNIWLFSATMPKEIAAIARNYMNDWAEVSIGKKNEGTRDVNHICYTVHYRDKYQALKRIADHNPDIYGIIFCRTRRDTQELADKLSRDGYPADALHGDLTQAQRDFVMQRFRNRNITLLVATDVAARGIDVEDLSHVINVNLPDDIEVYTHRSGRTGRAGKKGTSIVIIEPKEKYNIRRLEKQLNRSFSMMNVPTSEEICEKQLFHYIHKLETSEIANDTINDFMGGVMERLSWLSKEDLVKKLLGMEFGRLMEYYQDKDDIHTPSHQENERGGKRDRYEKDRDRSPSEGYTRIFIGLGKMDGLHPASLIELINKNTKGKMIPIGKIDLMRNFSFFEVDSEQAAKLVNNMENLYHNDRKVLVEIAAPQGSKNHSHKGGFKPGGFKSGGKFDKFKSSYNKPERKYKIK